MMSMISNFEVIGPPHKCENAEGYSKFISDIIIR